MRSIKAIVVLFSMIIFMMGCKNSESIALKKQAEDQKGVIEQLELKNQEINKEQLIELKNELQSKNKAMDAMGVEFQALDLKKNGA